MDHAATSSAGPVKFKVVLLGEGAVGKTSLLLRYIENQFNPKHVSTLQASFMCKKLNVDGQRVELNIWDTAGQERFHALGPIYYRDSSGAVLVFDLTDSQSFSKVKNWVKELRRMLHNRVQLVIVGNKCDLAQHRQVAAQEAAAYATSVGATYVETSAKTNDNIDTLFIQITQAMLSARASGALNGLHAARRGDNFLLRDENCEPSQNRQSKCC